MKKEILLFLVMLTFVFSNIQGQGKRKDKEYLHLIMAYTNIGGMDLVNKEGEIRDYDLRFDKILWRVEKDTIIPVDTLNVQSELSSSIRWINNFNQYGWMFISEFMKFENAKVYSDGSDYFEYYYSILDYSGDSIVIRRLYLPNSKLGEHEDLLDILNLIRDGIEVKTWSISYCEGDETQFAGFDRKFRYKKFDIDDMQYDKVVLYGNPSLYIERQHTVYAFDKKGTVHLYYGPRCNENETIEESHLSILQMPDSMKIDSGSIKMRINIPESRYAIFTYYSYSKKKSEKKKHLLGKTWFYDKETGKWEWRELPFGLPYAAYKEWLYGTKYKHDSEDDYIYFNAYKENGNNNSKLAYQRRMQYYEDSGIDISKYSEKYGFAPPLFYLFSGKLYLYHIPTSKYIEWDTGDLDSEMLSIMDGWIYYRVFDKIFRVKLDEKDKKIAWATKELLVQDREIVPNVHSIFWHKKSGMKEIWITEKSDALKQFEERLAKEKQEKNK